MKTRIIILNCAAILLLLNGCDMYWCDDPYYYDDCHDCNYDYSPPPVPRNVHSVTGDNAVYLYWTPVSSWDIEGYDIYRGYGPTGYYDYIGSSSCASFTDWTVYNGETYYYAVATYDYCGNQSDLSYDLVYDTPRPEGFSYHLWTSELYPNDGGYDFSEYSVVAWDYPTCDFYFGHDSIGYYLNAANDYTDIMEYGPIYDISDVDEAPISGWSPYADVEAVEGYGYILWTADNHFAVVLIRDISGERMTFDWAYQTDPGNPQLRITIEKPQAMLGHELRDANTIRRQYITVMNDAN